MPTKTRGFERGPFSGIVLKCLQPNAGRVSLSFPYLTPLPSFLCAILHVHRKTFLAQALRKSSISFFSPPSTFKRSRRGIFLPQGRHTDALLDGSAHAFSRELLSGNKGAVLKVADVSYQAAFQQTNDKRTIPRFQRVRLCLK